MLLKLGRAYATIEVWDDAIATPQKSISIPESIEDDRRVNQLKASAQQALGKVYLAKFCSTCTDESLPERNDELIREAFFWSEAALECQGDYIGTIDLHLDLFLDLAQEYYYLDEWEKAHDTLKNYLDGIVQLGPSRCHSCSQMCAKDAIIEK